MTPEKKITIVGVRRKSLLIVCLQREKYLIENSDVEDGGSRVAIVTPDALKWTAEHLIQELDGNEDSVTISCDRSREIVLRFAVHDTCRALEMPVPGWFKELW